MRTPFFFMTPSRAAAVMGCKPEDITRMITAKLIVSQSTGNPSEPREVSLEEASYLWFLMQNRELNGEALRTNLEIGPHDEEGLAYAANVVLEYQKKLVGGRDAM